MAKKQSPESFEVQEYSREQLPQDKFGAIYQIVEQLLRESPAAGCRVSFTGSLMKLTYHCYEMHLPSRMRIVEDQAKQVLNNTVNHIKKEFKKLRKETLDLKEKKEMANYSIEKVSLNERYALASWRFYEIGE